MKGSLVIGLDVDDVVAKLLQRWLAEYNEIYDDKMTVDDLVHWEISEQVKKEAGSKIFKLLTPQMYMSVEAYDGTQQAVRKIRAAGHKAWFITSAYSEDLFQAKVYWLNRMGFEYDRVIGVGEWSEFKTKQEIPGVDWLVDDHIGNLKGFTGYPVLQTRPHNRLLEWEGKRIKHLDDIVPALVYRGKRAEELATQPTPWDTHPMADVATLAFNGALPKDSKPSNPKDAIGLTKLPLHLVSGVVKAYDAIAHYLGNVKYGAWNYRKAGVRASIYKAALDRHMDRYWEGEWYDPADGTPHLANAKACLNILIEGHYDGSMTDDRPPSRDLNPLYQEFEGIMGKINEKYKDRDPRHYTIADTN